MNWCVLAEWTIPNQLHRLQSFESILSDKLGPVVDLNSFVDSNREEKEKGLMPNNNMLKAPIKQQVHALKETRVQCIDNWQEYIFVIQRDLPTLEKHVSSLHKHKDDVQKDFDKVEG